MKKIISIGAILFLYCTCINAAISETELPSKKFFKENIEVAKEEKTTSSSSLLKSETKKAFSLDDDESGEAGGGFVGGDEYELPAGDSILPMLLSGGMYMFCLKRRKRK